MRVPGTHGALPADRYNEPVQDRPVHLEVERDRGLRVTWPGGRESFYPTEHLRRMSPSAEARQLREELARNPLAILPNRPADQGPLRIVDAELVGHYALRLIFSDGHDTGIYTWPYLHAIDPERAPEAAP